MHETIRDVVESFLCTQCGTCVVVCPVDAIEMRETPAGQLIPFILEEKCTACGRCRQVCPGAAVDLDLPAHVDPFRGQVLAVYAGHSCEEAVRAKGQSGGVVSALLLWLLETDQIDAALVTTMLNDGSLRPKPILAKTREEILSAQGSKYCPSAPNAILADVAPETRIATVGVSCQMHGIHKLVRAGSLVAESVVCRIGLICDRTLLYSCIEKMALDARLDMDSIVGLEYRSKAHSGWPGEVCFHLSSGEERYYPSSLRTRLKDSFTPPRCRLCFDKMNVSSDLAIGDAWGISEAPRGDSIVIVRTERGASLLKNALTQGVLELKSVDLKDVLEHQGIERRRREFSGFASAWIEMGYSMPEYEDMVSYFPATVDAATRRSCRRKLSHNCQVAGVASRREALSLVRRRLLLSRMRSLLLSLVKRIGLGIRSLKLS